MSYLHDLAGDADKLVVNSHGQFVVVTPGGAVFRDFFTEDLTHVCIAFGRLFDGDWRDATKEESIAWYAKPTSEQMLRIEWNGAPPPEPRLRLIEGQPPRESKS